MPVYTSRFFKIELSNVELNKIIMYFQIYNTITNQTGKIHERIGDETGLS